MFFDAGEWVTWSEIDEQLRYKEWCAKYPNAKRSIITKIVATSVRSASVRLRRERPRHNSYLILPRASPRGVLRSVTYV